ncbi:TPA: hypothetical protein ACKP77_001983 [Serratia marcescens]
MKNQTPYERPIFGIDRDGKMRKNPNNLTIKQHILSAKQLSEWSVNGKTIHIRDIPSGEDRNITPDNEYFGVQRLWDQEIEQVFFKGIEDKYQEQVAKLKVMQVSFLSERVTAQKEAKDHDININALVDYYKISCIRCELSKKNRPHAPLLQDMPGEHTNAQIEENELARLKGHHDFVKVLVPADKNSQSIARFITRFAINTDYDAMTQKLGNTIWNLLFLEIGHDNLVISDALDVFYKEGYYLMPITPRILLISQSTVDKIGNALKSTIINDILKNHAYRFHTI